MYMLMHLLFTQTSTFSLMHFFFFNGELQSGALPY